jgi:Ca-activated chloride channel family protein
MSQRTNLLLFLGTCGAFAVGVTQLFGTTVSEKFSNANNSVSSQVTFGGPSDSASRSFAYPSRAVPAPARVPTPSYASPPPVPTQAQTPTFLDATSTFAIDVDTGSYTLSRRLLEGGGLPMPHQVRTEEFVNYFHYDYPAPPASRTATVQFEGAPSPFSTTGNTHLVRIGLQARGLRERVPVHVTFLVDTSGSMGYDDRLPLAQQAMRAAVQQLAPTDRVAIATYAGSSDLVLDSTPASRSAKIEQAIDSLGAGGGTAMGDGMHLAYNVASRYAGRDRVSRVFVMSDGDANIGRTTVSGMLDEVRTYADDGVTLSTVGFGTGNYNDALMEQLADAGNGNYTYIDSADEIPRAFVHGFDSLLHVVAKDVKVQVEFDADAVASWRQLGYDNRQLADHEFRDDRVDAGEIGARHQVTAIYEVTLKRGVSRQAPLAQVRFRYKEPHGSKAREVVSVMRGASLRPRIGDTSADFRFQAAVATFAERLRGGDSKDYGWIEEVASSAVEGNPERQRFVQLLRRARAVEKLM